MSGQRCQVGGGETVGLLRYALLLTSQACHEMERHFRTSAIVVEEVEAILFHSSRNPSPCVLS